MNESFVDLTYRGLPLGRRVKLTQVRSATGYLELPAPMPVGTTIGITTDELSTALASGQTIAQVAEANGSSAQAVIDALVARVEEHFADEVASGEHTQADADARIAEATTRITDVVNNGGMLGGPGGPGGPGHHGDGDMGGDMGGMSGSSGSIDGGPSDTATTVAGA